MQQNLKTQIDYWKKSAKRNLDTAEVLFQNKRYDSCLFFCHLSLEKLLKGLAVKQTKRAVPYIHYLEKLSLLAKLELTEEQIKNLRIITDFNIAGRYDAVKFAFYKKCTKDYTEKYFDITKKLFLWLEKKYQKN